MVRKEPKIMQKHCSSQSRLTEPPRCHEGDSEMMMEWHWLYDGGVLALEHTSAHTCITCRLGPTRFALYRVFVRTMSGTSQSFSFSQEPTGMTKVRWRHYFQYDPHIQQDSSQQWESWRRQGWLCFKFILSWHCCHGAACCTSHQTW